LLEEDRERLSEVADHRPSEFDQLSRINLEGLPRPIRECLEELASAEGRDHLNGGALGPFSRPKHGTDLLKVIQ
jgi:hypothetical protein